MQITQSINRSIDYERLVAQDVFSRCLHSLSVHMNTFNERVPLGHFGKLKNNNNK